MISTVSCLLLSMRDESRAGAFPEMQLSTEIMSNSRSIELETNTDIHIQPYCNLELAVGPGPPIPIEGFISGHPRSPEFSILAQTLPTSHLSPITI